MQSVHRRCGLQSRFVSRLRKINWTMPCIISSIYLSLTPPRRLLMVSFVVVVEEIRIFTRILLTAYAVSKLRRCPKIFVSRSLITFLRNDDCVQKTRRLGLTRFYFRSLIHNRMVRTSVRSSLAFRFLFVRYTNQTHTQKQSEPNQKWDRCATKTGRRLPKKWNIRKRA